MFSKFINYIYEEKNKYEKELAISQPFIEGDSTGKRMRSILFYRWATITNELLHKTVAIIESIHNVSLMHDDVIDSNNVRRRKESYYRLLGAKESILCGDYLLIKIIKKFLELHEDNYIRRIFFRECEAIALGAILEQKLNKSNYVTIEKYIRMASLKTGSLFKLSCFLGAFLSNGNFENAKKAAIWGVCFGILFQIQNDIDSYLKSESFEDSEDYIQKNVTFPIVLMNYDLNLFKKINNQKEYDFIKNAILSEKFKEKAIEITKKYYIQLSLFT